MSPREVDKLSLWEFKSMVDGYEVAHAPPEPPKISAEEHDALVDKYRHLD